MSLWAAPPCPYCFATSLLRARRADGTWATLEGPVAGTDWQNGSIRHRDEQVLKVDGRWYWVHRGCQARGRTPPPPEPPVPDNTAALNAMGSGFARWHSSGKHGDGGPA